MTSTGLSQFLRSLRHRAATSSAVLALIVLSGSSDVWAQFYVSQLGALSRSGAQAGTTVELTVASGDKLDEVDRLHFSHPGITAEVSTLQPLPFAETRVREFGRFSVRVAEDVPPGRYEVRAGGRHGLTNPRAFLVTLMPHETPALVSLDPSAPTPLPLGILLHANSTAADVDYYELDVREGQSLRIEVIAQRLDSQMIGQLKLLDSENRLVASSRGADDVDPTLAVDNLSGGQYRLAVHDFLFRGGDDFHYQLVAQEITLPADFIRGVDEVAGQLPHAWFTRACTLRREQMRITPEPTPRDEQTPRGQDAAIHQISVPGQMSRWFDPDNADTLIEFPASEGQQLAIDLISHRVGQPTDARIMIQRIEPQQSGTPKLHDILNADDGQSVGDSALSLRTKDPMVLFTAPAEARYRMTIRDLDVGQSLSLRQKFRLRIRDPKPGFDLVAYRVYPHRDANQSQPLGSKLFRGGSEAIGVLAIRRDGWKGPITILAENLPAGVQCKAAVMAANQNQTHLILRASDDAAEFAGPIRLTGHSDDGALKQPAEAATLAWGRGGGRDFIRSRISTDLHVAVSARDVSPLTISLGDDSVAEAKMGDSLSLPIKIIRREGGKAACVLRPRDLPPGVTAGEITIPAEKSEATLVLKVAQKGAAPGSYSMWLQAETKIKIKPNPQALERALQYRAHLQDLQDDPAQTSHLESIKSAIAQADKQVEAAKAGAKEQELTVFIPSSNATFQVVHP